MAIDAGDVIWHIGAESKGLQKGLDKATKGAKNLSASFMKHSKAIGTAMTVAGAAITASFGGAIKTWAEAGDEIQKMAERTGFATETLSELKFAAERSGASLNAIEKSSKKLATVIFEAGEEMKISGEKGAASLEKLNQKIDIARIKHEQLRQKVIDGKATREDLIISQKKGNALLQQQSDLMSGTAQTTGTYTSALRNLGLSYKALEGLSAEDQFLKVAMALGALTDQTTKVALAQELFGRSGTELITMFNSGEAGMEALRAKAVELGIVFSEDGAAKAAEFQDTMLDLKVSGQALMFVIAKTLAPSVKRFAEFATEAIQKVREWTNENPMLAANMLRVAAAVGAAMLVLGPLLIILPGLATAFSALSAILPVVGAALVFLTGPIGLVIAAVIAMTAIIVSNWDFIKAKTDFIFQGIGNLLGTATGRWLLSIRNFVDNVRRAIAIVLEFLGLQSQANAVAPPARDRASGGVVEGFAKGGAIKNRIVRVGERGPELIAAPIGSRVISHPDMMRAQRQGASQGGGFTGNVAPVFNVTINGEQDPDRLMEKLKGPFSQWMSNGLKEALS